MAFSLKGIHVPHRKNTVNKPVARMPLPTSVTIPMSMHIGAPATPIVKVGDKVKIGTKIAEASSMVSSPIYSSVSGKVSKIKDFLLSNGSMTQAIVIDSDGEGAIDEGIKAPFIDSRESFINALKESGIVGLGGAGFPTHVKFNVDPEKVEYLIVNGAECEPYVTSDTATMLTRVDDMKNAIIAINKYIGVKNVIIGIENNKNSAIKSMKGMAKDLSEVCAVDVKVLPSLYPQGGEKVLIYNTIGRVIKTGMLPIDVGCIIVNCTTLASIGNYLETGMPLVEKCVTVDGGAIRNPQNVIAPVGASFEDVFNFCDGLVEAPAKLIYGGPMMGITVPNIDQPILKNTNAILALTEKEVKLPSTTACIRCGSCTNTCPFGLAPAEISLAYDKNDIEALIKLNVRTCMECGCCNFVCPANRPLVQKNKLSKVLLKNSEAKEEK